MSEFGEFLRSERLEKGLGLRKFSGHVGLEPAYISRMERGKVLPPKDQETLKIFAEILGFEENSDKYIALFDLAARGRGTHVPADVEAALESPELIPVLLRTISDKKVSKEDLAELVEYIKENY